MAVRVGWLQMTNLNVRACERSCSHMNICLKLINKSRLMMIADDGESISFGLYSQEKATESEGEHRTELHAPHPIVLITIIISHCYHVHTLFHSRRVLKPLIQASPSSPAVCSKVHRRNEACVVDASATGTSTSDERPEL